MLFKLNRFSVFVYSSILAMGCQSGLAPVVKSPAGLSNTAGSAQTSSNAQAYYYFMAAQIKQKQGAFDEALWYLEKAVQFDEQSVRLKMELAEAHLIQKQNSKALAVLHQVLTDHPDNVDALILSGRIYLQQNDIPEARTLLEKALTFNPDDQTIYFHLGQIYWNENDYANAGRIFRKMSENFPEFSAAHYYYGKVLVAQGKYDLAEKSFVRCLQLDPAKEAARFELVEIYKSRGQMKKVIDTYESILDINPDNIAAAMAIAVQYRNLGQQKSGLPVLEDLGQRSLDDNTVLTYLYETYIDTKQFDTAVWIMEGMLRGAEDNSELHYLLGVAYDGLKQPGKALRHLAKVENSSRFFKNAVVHQTILLRDSGKTDQAIDVVSKALLSDPFDPDYYLYLGAFYEEKKEYDKAVQVLDKGLGIEQDNVRILFRSAVVYDKAGNKTKSIEAVKRILEIKPDDADALNFLGYTYADLGINLDEAEVLIQNALKQKPDDGYIADSLAWVYYKKGQYEDALKWLRKAIELVPNDATILEHLGDVYLKLGIQEKALKYYSRSLEVRTEDRQKLEEKIRALKDGSAVR